MYIHILHPQININMFLYIYILPYLYKCTSLLLHNFRRNLSRDIVSVKVFVESIKYLKIMAINIVM